MISPGFLYALPNDKTQLKTSLQFDCLYEMKWPEGSLKAFLDEKAARYNTQKFIASDPVSVPRQFKAKADIEISGLLAATIAWGQRATIINNARRLVNYMDGAPYDFIMNFTEADLSNFRKFVHRTFNGEDCVYFLWALKNIYQQYGGLEQVFTEGFSLKNQDVFSAIMQFRTTFFELEHPARTLKHVANPSKNASAKRINMFLRWMVRKDESGVDFGIWNNISPAQLVCPLDVHSARVARKLGLLSRKMNDWKAATELTANLKKFNAEDPVKYDFALFGLGVFEKF